MRNKAFLLIKLLILILLCIWILNSVNVNETIKELEKTNLFYFFLALLINNFSTFFFTIKWYRLAKPLKIKSGFFELFKLNYISLFYSIFVPGQASGEIIKGVKFSMREGSISKAFVPIFIDKVTNLLMTLLIGLAAILSDEKLNNNLNLIYSISLMAIICLFFTIISFSDKTDYLIQKVIDLLVKIFDSLKLNSKTIKDLSPNYFEDYKKHNLLMIETLFWSLLTKLPHIATFYLLALSINIHLNLIQSAWLFSIVSIASLLPISFSGLGVREGTMILFLSQVGVSNSNSLSLSVLIFTCGIITGLIGGLIELSSWLNPKTTK